MRRSTVLILGLGLASIPGAVALQPRDVTSCPQIHAYLAQGQVCADTFVRIDGVSASGNGPERAGETFHTYYDVTFGYLSGNYKVDAINGSCIELCTCQ